MDVLLVGLDDDLMEMRALLASAGHRIVREVVQNRQRPDPRYFVGKGKLDALKKDVEVHAVEAVVFAGTIRPNQHYELEKALGVPCHDRLQVILDIFTQRANSPEAKLQVEYAMLQYEIPILREWIHAGALGERPGFMAGGEYRVDAYYETVKRRMVKVRKALEAIREERGSRRRQRGERGFYHVSIAGYANAGKSSLFNALSGEQVLVEDRLFTTLSTTTRSMGVRGKEKRILLTDTVGFVSDVPLWMVEAFRSTFEEAFESDLLLLLVDSSDTLPMVENRVRLATKTLIPGIDAPRVQPILTKVDLVAPEKIAACRSILEGSVFTRPPLSVSMKTGEGLASVRAAIVSEFRFPMELTIRVRLRGDTGSFIHWLHEHTEILEMTDGAEVRVRLRCRERDVPMIEKGADVLTATARST